MLAQYGPPSEAPLSGEQSSSSDPHPSRHSPPAQSVPLGHTLPHDPQLLLSVIALAQYAGPPSVGHSVCPSTQLCEQAPSTHA